MKKYFILIMAICCILVSCKPDPTLPTVTTIAVEEITESSALCVGYIKDNGNAEITAKGFCWSTNQNPTLEDDFTTELIQTRNEPAYPVNFESRISDLTANTEYYVRAFATNEVGTAYGENVKFITMESNNGEEPENPETPEDPENPENPENPEDPETPEDPENPEEPTLYEYVDLGLQSGVKWATCNVGATTPEGFGDYFAWGEITTKEAYESSNCSSYHQDLGDISGNADYDVVKVQWGGDWRMPRLEDMYELVTQCTWIWANVNGVGGYNVVSNVNGKHIFIPASGFMKGNEVFDQGTFGYYWTSTPYSEELEGGENTNTKACYLDFSSSYYITEWSLRRNGFTVRPVMD